MAEERARNKLPEGIFDSLPDIVKQTMIQQEQQFIEHEKQIQQREEEYQKELKEREQQHEQELKRHEEEIAKEKEELTKREEEAERNREEFERNKEEIEFMFRNMFRIDRSTPSIEEMETTRNEKRIEQSREYLELGQDVQKKMMAREITADEGRTMLDNKVVELKRYMSARYQREYRKKANTSRKKVERDYVKLESKGWDKDFFDMDTVNDTTMVNGELFSVLIPSRDELIERAMKLQRNIIERQKKPLLRPQHYCMVSIELKGTQRFVTKTNLVPILSPDGYVNNDFMDKINKFIVHQLDRAEQYEEKNSEIICSRITMSYTISQWESIKNWYPDNTPTEPTMKFKDFTIFLASDEEINCEQQIVEYLKCKWEPSKTLEEMLGKKVMTYIPCQGDIRYVRQFSDLMTAYHEDIDNTDCVSVARIIKWNDHMALITEIVPTRRNVRVQRRRAISSKSEEYPEVFVDIEAFQKDCEQIPYLVCWADGDEISQATGEECIAEFVDQLLDKYQNQGHIVLYAWYGSGYDYQHIYKYLKAKCTYDNCHLRNNAIIYAEFHYEPLNLVIHLKDPYLFVLTSLDKAAKAFGVLNKGSFPHDIVKDWDDLDKVLHNWVHLRSETVERYDGKVALISTNTWEEIDQDPNYQTVLERAIEYCTVDVLAMQQIWYKFSKLVHKELEMKIGINIFTLSQLSMRLMEGSLPKNVWLYVPDRDQYNFMRDAIYGGRVVANNGDYQEPILYADVVSLYPSGMKLLQHAYGKPIHKKGGVMNWDVHGIYDVTLTHKDDQEPSDYMKFVARRIDGKLHWDWFKQHRGTYHTYDLLIAKDQGYSIECHEGWEYPSKGYLFDAFIDKLYKLKEDHSNCDCPHQPCPLRMVGKIALNGGGYGKYVQKPIDVDTYIVRRDVIAGECARLEENAEGEVYFGGTLIKRPVFQRLDGDEYDKMMFEMEQDPYYATQIGISILSASRYRLYNLCKEFPGMEVIYSDTDSIFVRKASVDWELFKEKCGTSLGQLDDTIGNTKHGVIHRMLVGGPKMYAYEYNDDAGMPQITMHCKGVPTSMLSLKQFEHLIEDKDHKLAYSFSIMRKRLVGVQRLNIVKEIIQT